MRHGSALGLLLAASAFAQSQPPTPTPAHNHDLCGIDACGKAALLRRMFNHGLSPNGEGGEGGDGGGFTPREDFLATDVLHNNLDLEIFPTTENIAGSNTMTIRSMVDNLTEFTFCLRNNFTISEIRFNDTTSLAPAAMVGSYTRRVTLPRPVLRGEVFTLRIAYQGEAVSRGFGSIEFTTLGGQPAVFTLSEPYYAATWWPAKDGDFAAPGDNADKATFDIAITAPANLTVASNGLLQGIETLSGNRRKHRWSTNYPMASYLACFGAAVYNTWSTTYTYPGPGGPATMPLNFFISPNSDEPAQRQAWQRSTDMMAAFRPVYGEYPFVNEKYGIYQFTFGGGMEHQTMTGQSATTSLSLTAHELAHQWWGDNVTCRTWSDIWLNEGFATYSECIWAERSTGTPDRAALLTAINARRPGNLSSGSVYRYDVSSADTIFSGTFAYNKGAWVLHTLRKTLGDAKFFELLQYYRSIFEGSAATTDDFAAAATLIAGWNMAPYFDAWVYGEGTPTFAYGSQRAVINGQPYLRLRIRQSQPAPARAYFPCGLDVRITTASGTQDAFVIPGGATSWHLIPLTVDGAVTSVTLDREDWVLNQGKVAEAYISGPPRLTQATPAPGAVLTAAPASIQIAFSDNVTAASQAFTLMRGPDAVPFTYSYNPSTYTATLTPTTPLTAGTYIVSVAETVTANAGQRLDGELTSRGFPTGNGVAGGASTFSFTLAPCAADFNRDSFLDFFDYDDFVNCFQNGVCGGSSADFNNDGFVDFFDYDDFVAAFQLGC